MLQTTPYLYLLDVAKAILEPLGKVLNGEYGGIKDTSSDHWRTRKLITTLEIPLDEKVKDIFKNYISHPFDSSIKFRLFYYEDNEMGCCYWEKSY